MWLQKCDEDINELGECKACVRLHLECLGFGQKRPEWLKVCGLFLRGPCPLLAVDLLPHV
jgi:hypothetical protein